jgi:hypothetical protein
MDHMNEIIVIVRDAIIDGLIKSETIGNYKRTVKRLKKEGKQAELEDYIQKLWDEL